MGSADLFFGDKNEVDRPFELLALLLQPPHSLNVLDAHTFHVLDQEKGCFRQYLNFCNTAVTCDVSLNLSSTAIDVSLLIFMGREGRVRPVLRKN